ncbi:MAG: sugar phosphate isomerase/epimerase [Planctomycetaceae bacterium]|nr:sugar phosphate isomerase/epimerase [Planctomycetaceae bacterium]
MTDKLSRRNFLATSAMTAASAGLYTAVGNTFVSAQESKADAVYTAQIVRVPEDARCAEIKAAGFDGIEVTGREISIEEAEKGRKIADKHGLKVHSVMRGWTNINNPDAFDKDIESVKHAIKLAAVFGADAVLWVPCRTGGGMNPKEGRPTTGIAMPAAWDFDIDFDPATLRVKSVAPSGDYSEYVAEQNKATEATIKAVGQLIPVLEAEKINLGIENVWNNLWSTPKYYAALCKFFKHPRVGSYFDLGNHAVYANPVEWLKALGKEKPPYKLHIKGFKVEEVKGKLGGGPGNWCPVDESSIDWKAVRQTMRDIGYTGWLTVEEGRRTDKQYVEIMTAMINS